MKMKPVKLLALLFALLMVFQMLPVIHARADNLLVNYNFDDNILDTSGCGNNGSIGGTVSYVAGYHGKALSLTGNGYISLPRNLILNNTSFTVSMRFKTTGKGGLFGYQNNPVGTVATEYVPILCIRSDGKLYAEMWTGNSMTVLSNGSVADGQWHRVVMTSGASSIRVYLDGVDIGGASGSPRHLSMSLSQIGTNAAWGRPTESTVTGDWNYFTGLIDDFAFYSTAQTAQEVAKTDQAITFNDSLNKTTDDVPFALTATASSGLPVSYVSSNTSVATVSSGIVTIVGPGTTNITASQAGDATYSAAPSVTRTLTVQLSDADCVAEAKAALDADDDFTYGGTDTAAAVTQNFTLPLLGINGTTISWAEKTDSGNNVSISDNTATITRPTYGQGDATVTLTATISKNGETDTKDITITIKKAGMTDADCVAAAKAALDAGDFSFGVGDSETAVTKNFTLPLTGGDGTTINWAEKTDSGNNVNLSSDGSVTVTRPTYSQGDATVTLTATISKNGETDTKDITVTIKKAGMTDADCVADAKEALDAGDFSFGVGDSETAVTQNFTLPLTGGNGTTISWDEKTDSGNNVNLSSGGSVTVTRPTYGQGDATVTLTATISKNGETVTKDITVTIKEETGLSDADCVAAAEAALDAGDFTYGGGDTAAAVTQDFTLPLLGGNGTTINWAEKTDSGNNMNLSSGTASVTRPAYGQGDATVTLTATISKNGETVTKDITVTIKEAAAPYVAPESTSKPGPAVIVINGNTQQAGTETRETKDGKSTVTVKVDHSIAEKITQETENSPDSPNSIEIAVSGHEAEAAKVELTGDIVKTLEDKQFNLSVKRENIDYVIPAAEFTIGEVANQLGVPENNLKNIQVQVQITNLDEKTIDLYREIAKASGAELVFPPVEFKIVATTLKTDGSSGAVEISRFSNYVERVMEIPGDVGHDKITTGIVFNPDGTFSHVPTQVFQKDGKWYAKLNSLTNSEYSVIWNPVTVESVENHWAEEAVNDLASRLVIFNPETFEPDKAITRADFLEYIVRALGLYREGTAYENKYADVSSTDERTLAILIATEYGIITGYPDGSFKPNQLITREEAMVVYQRAMGITKLSGDDTARYQNYSDFSKVGAWAVSSVKEVLAAHIFNGTSLTTLSPKSNLTYAEAAQAIRNLLVESNLINK